MTGHMIKLLLEDLVLLMDKYALLDSGFKYQRVEIIVLRIRKIFLFNFFFFLVLDFVESWRYFFCLFL